MGGAASRPEAFLPHAFLPGDWQTALLVGRIRTAAGPTPVVCRDGRLLDVSSAAVTVSDLLNFDVSAVMGGDLGPIEAFDFAAQPLLAPIDLQCVKAAGVTFAVSAVERVIEERARGDAAKAEAIRADLRDRVGADIRSVVPGGDAAAKLKAALIADGLWSQYLEVAIGPDAEIFTKAPVLSAVGHGAQVGIRSDSAWNNPEPEVVLVCDRDGKAVGATLGNDVNLRDFEGRSALLLGKAKDNNASCAIGPFIRLFDEKFNIDHVRRSDLNMTVTGTEGFEMKGGSSLSKISRDPLDLVAQAIGANHQYPDGFMLFLGTMFAPTQDRHGPGQGFTHVVGDVVTVATPQLGSLVNRVTTSDKAAPWTFGISALMKSLAKRGLV